MTEVSSAGQPAPAKRVPDGVDPAALYDGPKLVALPSGKGAFTAPASDQAAAALTRPIPQVANPVGQAPQPLLQAPPPPPVPVTQAQMKMDYPQVVALAMDVLSARLLGLISLVAACAIWGYVIVDPQFWRIIGAASFSALVFLPVMAIYWRAGMTGDGG